MTRPARVSTKIEQFQGEYRWLSNFWPCRVALGPVEYPSVEHAYQAAKTHDVGLRTRIRSAKPGEAKRMGKKVALRAGWEAERLIVMAELVKSKFTLNPDLAEKLLATGDAELIEGNYWGDTFWGVCKGQGENMLGKILMKVRDELQKEKS